MKLSPVCRKLILVIFSSPGSASFPMGSFHILNLGLQLFCFMLSLWDLSQTSTASQSPNLWPCLTMLLPPLSLLVSWAYIVSSSLPNIPLGCHTSPLWPWTYSETDLTVFVHNPGSFSGLGVFVIGKRAEPQHYLWVFILSLNYYYLYNQLHTSFCNASPTNCIHPFAMPLMSISFFFHCWHFGQAFNSQYGVLAHNRDERTGSGPGPPMFWFELYSWLCDWLTHTVSLCLLNLISQVEMCLSYRLVRELNEFTHANT